MKKVRVLLICLGWFCTQVNAETLKINGSSTVNPPVSEASEILRAEQNMDIHVDTQGGSSGGISMLAEGLVDIGMSSKPLTDKIKGKYPTVDFHLIRLGKDAVALVVSADVWEGGIHSISKEQMSGIYEKKITNWKEIGGPDKRIAFFNKEPGRGTWEVFAKWLYGKSKNAPLVSWPEVGGNEETRNKVGSTRGALSQLSASWVDNKTVFALALVDEAGNAVAPDIASIVSGAYAMSRPLFLLTNGEPSSLARDFVEFMMSDRGQKLISKHGYLSNLELSE